MVLPPLFRKQLTQSIQSAFSAATFQDFTQENPIGLTYLDTLQTNDTFPLGIGHYADAVAAKGLLNELLDALITEGPQNKFIQDVYAAYKDIFLVVGGEVKFQDKAFKRELLNNASGIFIPRDVFSDRLCKMVNKNGVTLICLTGKSKAGNSFMSYYLGEIASQLKCFNFLNLNLFDIGEDQPEESISSAHLAEIIASRLDMPFSGIKDFKITPFLSSLETRLEELARDGSKWLFFIDQFTRVHTPDVRMMVKKMAKMVLLNPDRFFLIFSSYKDWEKDWDYNDVLLIEEINFDSFTQAEIESYLDRLYENLLNNKKLDPQQISKGTFIDAARINLPGQLFSPNANAADPPNVTAISLGLKSWFREMKKKFA